MSASTLTTDGSATERRLVAELGGTAMTTAVIMAAGVVTGLLAARALGPAGRGELTAVTIWPTAILYAGSFGLSDATVYYAASRRNLAGSIFVTAQGVSLLLGALVSILGWLMLPLLLYKQTPTTQDNARIYLLCFVIPGFSSLSACAWLQGVSLMKEMNVARAAVHVVTALLMGIMTIAGLASVRNYLVAMLVGNSATWLLGFRACHAHRGPSAQWQPALIRRMLSYGTKVQFGSWSAAANVRLDQLVLSSFAASASLGLYVVGLSYAGLVNTLPAVAGIVMLPRLIHDCGLGVGGATLATWYRRVLWSTLGAGVGLWLTAGVALPILFGGRFHDSVALEAVLIPSSCILGMNQFLAIGFRGHGLPGVASRGEVIGLFVTIPLLAVLLPRYDIYGAAVTSLCAYGTVSVYLLSRARAIVPEVRALWLPTADDWLVAKNAARLVTSAVMRRAWPSF